MLEIALPGLAEPARVHWPPALTLTGTTRSTGWCRRRARGVQDHVTKPLPIADLLTQVRFLLLRVRHAEVVAYRDVAVDAATCQAWRGGGR